MRGKIAKLHPDPVKALAVCLYAALQPGLQDNKIYGYVVNFLRSGQEPDRRYLRWASLTPDQWRALWRADRYGEWSTLLAREWHEDFGGLWDAGPFGDQGRGQVPPLETQEENGDDDEAGAIEEAGAATVEIPGCSMTAAKVWQTALGQLQMQMARATFDMWMRQTSVLSYEDGLFVVRVQNGYAKDWIEHRLRNLIHRTLTDITGLNVQVQFEVKE